MAKVLYSLLLDPEIVSEIDNLAYKHQASRSGFINEILAEYVSVATPQKRQKNIFDALEELINQSSKMQVMLTNSNNLLTIRSPITYRYNPTIRYNVAITREGGEITGEIRMCVRTQNNRLLQYLYNFFAVLISLEKKYADSQNKYLLEPGKLTKTFRLQEGANTLSDREIGQVVAKYINTADKMLTKYFSQINEGKEEIKAVEAVYMDYMSENEVRL